jgi:hypothetical protein
MVRQYRQNSGAPSLKDKNNKTAAKAGAKSRKNREDFKCDF